MIVLSLSPWWTGTMSGSLDWEVAPSFPLASEESGETGFSPQVRTPFLLSFALGRLNIRGSVGLRRSYSSGHTGRGTTEIEGRRHGPQRQNGLAKLGFPAIGGLCARPGPASDGPAAPLSPRIWTFVGPCTRLGSRLDEPTRIALMPLGRCNCCASVLFVASNVSWFSHFAAERESNLSARDWDEILTPF